MGWFDDNGFGDPTSSAGPAGTAPYDPTQMPGFSDWQTGPDGRRFRRTDWGWQYEDGQPGPPGGPAVNPQQGGQAGGNLAPAYANAGQQMPAGLEPPPYTGDPQSYVQQLQQQLQSAGISPKQEDPTAINYIVSALRKAGVTATPVGNDKFTDGISINGQPGFKLISGQNSWLPGFQTYAQAEGGGSGGGGGFGSVGALADFNAPGPFQAPTLEDARNSPGYQFALEQGMKGIQNSAAAKGTLLTGGTLKALQGYGTGLADQTYGNVFNRALATNTTNFGQALQGNEQNYKNWYNLAALGRPQ